MTGLSPTAGPTVGGTSVIITGTDFTGATKVAFGGAPAASYTVNSATAITAVNPARVAGVVNVVVTTPGGASAVSAASRYTYTTAPTVSSLSPSSGPMAGGISVTISGSGFTGATTVTFGGTASLSYTVESATKITATSPGHPAATVHVQVTTAGGTSPMGGGSAYVYAARPAISALSPSSGTTAGGTSVSITGSNLSGTTKVAFGGTPATSFTVNTATSITAVSPPRAAGVANVSVTTPGGISPTGSSSRYTYVTPPPKVTGVSPTGGSTHGGDTVTVSGTDFTGTTQVAFGGTPGAGILVASGGASLTVTSPAHAAGTVDVTVTTPAGTSSTSSADKFTYAVPPPTVTGVSPSRGPLSGGTLIRVAGTDLTGALQVTFGSTPGTSVKVAADGTSLTVRAPAQAAGKVDIRVTTAAGRSDATPADKFLYSAATIDHCGEMTSNQTWAAGLTHLVSCPVTVDSGVTLTVAPGAVVKFDYSQYTALTIDGSIRATGLTDGVLNQPVFTSLADDVVAGDTNNDGTATSPSPGNWDAVYIDATGQATLDHIQVDYAYWGIYNQSPTLTVTNSDFAQNSRAAITLPDGTTFDPSRALAGNTATNNGINGVLAVNPTWPDGAKLGAGANQTMPYVVSGTAQVPTGATVTAPAGTVVKFDYSQYTSSAIYGTLKATGTAAKPVVFTSLADDVVAGDTNNDGTATSPSPGNWDAVYIDATGQATLDHIQVDYAYWGIYNQSPTLTVTNSDFAQNSRAAITLPDGTTFDPSRALAGNTATNNGINGVLAVNPTWPDGAKLGAGANQTMPYVVSGTAQVPTGATVTAPAGTVVKFDYSQYTASAIYGTLKATGTAAKPVVFTSLADDVVAGDTNNDGTATSPSPGNWDAVYIDTTGQATLDHIHVDYSHNGLYTDGGALSLTNSEVSSTSSAAAYIANTSVDLATLNGNSGSGNGTNGIVLVNTTQAATSTVALAGTLVPVLDAQGDCATPALTVPAGVTLTLSAGSVVKAINCASLTVKGSLITQGTTTQKVVLTSARDDTIRGDTNGDGNGSGPAAGDWQGILLRSGGTKSLTNTAVRYAG